ncbi:MAG: VCBS repeat-containing protein, partial [Nitrospirae bacterium]|nr:VCBS repeat-containing protein [Nitrospirota bacterium]
MLKKNRRFLFLSVLFILIFAATNEAAEIIETKLDEVAKVFETYFPTMEGNVTSVEDKVIRINLGKKSGLMQGMILPVIKEGKEFQHPVTKEVLGKHEVEAGYIELKEVRDEFSAGSLIAEKKDPVRIGDKVRITAGKIKIALIPATTESNIFIIDRFADALEETGRFAVIPPDEIERIKKEHPNENTIEISRRVADAFKITSLFIVNTAPSKDKTLFTVELVAIPGNAKIAGLTALLRLPSRGPLTIEDDPQLKAFVVKKKEFWKKEEVPFGIRWLSVGDVDGDGKNEIVVSNGNKIRVYRYIDGKFDLIWEEKDAKRAYNQLYMDVADINGNGRAEIFVTNLIKDKLYSYVIEWKDGEFKKIQKDMPYYM